MAALNERQKRFVHALFLAPRSHGSRTFAAKTAGYGTPTSSRKSLSQIGHQLSADQKIQAAISEVSASYLTTLGPPAVRALKRLLDDPKHKDHGRALGIVMDSVTPVTSTALVKVEGEVKLSAADTARVMERIEQLACKIHDCSTCAEDHRRRGGMISKGHKYTLVCVSLTKKCLQAKMPAEMRLEFLQHLEKMADVTLTPAVIAAVEPMCDGAYEIVREAQKPGPKALDVYADKFDAFATLNPSLIASLQHSPMYQYRSA